MLLVAILFATTTSTMVAQELSKELPTTNNAIQQLQTTEELEHAKNAVATDLKIEELKVQNELDAAKKLKQQQKIEAQKQKAELKAQKQTEKEQKLAIKKQNDIIKSQKKLEKTTAKLHKAQDKFNAENIKFIQKKALGKLTPIDELKGKGKLLKLQTKITELEFEVKRQTLQVNALTK